LRDFSRKNLREQTKTLSVQASQGVQLDNLQDLLPIGNPTHEENQRQRLLPRQPGRFRAAAKYDQLLPQKGVFGQQSSSTAREIGQSASHQVRTGRLG
jgi:hypothetical protein